MGNYSQTATFTATGGQNAYTITVDAATYQVAGGTRVDISGYVTMTRNPGTPAFASGGTKAWRMDGARSGSTSGPIAAGSGTNQNGANVSWSYDFRNQGVPASQSVYGGFIRYIPTGDATATLSLSAAGSGSTFLTSKTVNLTVPLFTNTTFTATYNGNGSTSGSTSSTSYVSPASSSGTIANNGFIRTGYSFAGWNTAANGTGTSYGQGASFTGNLNLFAQWNLNSYSISYNPSNGTVSGTGSTSGSAVSYPSTSITTRANGFTPPSGYVFGGWSTSQDNTLDYSVGTGPTVNLESSGYSVTYYPVWVQPNPVFSVSTITTTGKLARNVNLNPDFTVVSAPVTGYSIIYSGTGLNPTSWLSINSSGQLSGAPTAQGTYTFKIRATNDGNNTDTAEISFVVTPTGMRLTGDTTRTSLATAKRFNGASWTDLTIMKKFIGVGQPGADSNGWISISNIV